MDAAASSSRWWTVCFFLGGRLALAGLDRLVTSLAARGAKLPPSPPPPPLRPRDAAFLACNSLVEHLFLLNLAHFARDRPGVGFATIPTLYLLLWLDDVLYAGLHAALHLPILYPWIHAHHHRVAHPTRGYLDAANEHPIEQILALAVHTLVVYALDRIIVVDGAAIASHLAINAVAALMTHVDHDLCFYLCLGLTISTKHHREHHVFLRRNFGQFRWGWSRG